MYSRAEEAFSSGCGYSACSVWQSVQLAPMAPWTDAAQASGSIVMSFEEPSLNKTDEPGCPWHRLMLDGCIPPGCRVRVASRCAEDVALLNQAPFQVEPLPVLRPYDVVFVPKSFIGKVGMYVELYINRIIPKSSGFMAFYELNPVSIPDTTTVVPR